MALTRVSPQALAKRIARAAVRLPAISAIVRYPPVVGVIEKMPGARLLYGAGWTRIHPFDRAHGTDTSGFAPAEELPENEGARAYACFYAGSQPNVLRLAIAALPPVDACAFVDLGCGKGRALLVASEFPFREILGIELSPALAKVARRNAAVMARRFPRRTAVRVAVGDASVFPLPPGDLVLFLYHPFGPEVVASVVARVEAAIAAAPWRNIYVVYYNPVAGHCFDASRLLRRRFAGTLPYGPDELGFGPDQADPVVVWHGGAASTPPPAASANARILVTPGGLRATLEEL
jgi:SAM-dependent methyltransferase